MRREPGADGQVLPAVWQESETGLTRRPGQGNQRFGAGVQPANPVRANHPQLVFPRSGRWVGWIRRGLVSPWLAWSIILLGAVLRLRGYLANRSLWFDEASLSLNILNRGFGRMFQPLDANQAAPPGFLVLEKISTLFFGRSEYALRLIPLISALLALVIFYQVIRLCLIPEIVPLALTIFAVSGALIYYTAEVKQYSSDVLVGLLLIWMALEFDRRDQTWLNIGLIALAGAASVWFSHPAVFGLAGIGCILIGEKALRRDWKNVRMLLLAGAVWAASFVGLYLLVLQKTDQNSALQAYWGSAFPIFPPRSLADLQLDGRLLLATFTDPGGFSESFLAPLLWCAGWVGMVWRKKKNQLLLTAPLLFALAASWLHLYPYSGRLLLFLVPSLVIFISEGIFQLRIPDRGGTALIRILLVALLIYQPVKSTAKTFINPSQREEIKPVLAFVQSHWQAGDSLYVYNSAQPAFSYYGPQYGFSMDSARLGMGTRGDLESYRIDLAQLRGKKRVWVLFAHVFEYAGMNEQDDIRGVLKTWGKEESGTSQTGAAAYLYNLSPN
jgi:hypothetical protein